MSDVSNELDLSIALAKRRATEVTDIEEKKQYLRLASFLETLRGLSSTDLLSMIADTVNENRELKARNQSLLESNNVYLENYRRAVAALETMKGGVRGLRGQGDVLEALDRLLA